MKPAFALSLTVEGIRLLHRSGGTWHLVGEVKLDTADLAADLATLRKTALALDPKGLRTKLLIPNDQIRYIALDTTRVTVEDVETALDGATPYAVDELAYDFSRGGGRTYIAAVARETLDEAEAFAVEHRFAPVCFAAAPEPFTFNGEPFFGASAAAAELLPGGESPERDDQPVDPKTLRAPRARLPWEKTGKMPAPPLAAGPGLASEPEVEFVPEPEAEPQVMPEPENVPELETAPEPSVQTEAEATPEVAVEHETELPDNDPIPEPAEDEPPVETPVLDEAPAPAEPVDLADDAPDEAPLGEPASDPLAEPEEAELPAPTVEPTPAPAPEEPASTDPAPESEEPPASFSTRRRRLGAAAEPAPAPSPDATPMFASRARKWGSEPRAGLAPSAPPEAPQMRAPEPPLAAPGSDTPKPASPVPPASAKPPPLKAPVRAPAPKAPAPAAKDRPKLMPTGASAALAADPSRAPGGVRPASPAQAGPLRPEAPGAAAPPITGLSPEAKPAGKVKTEMPPALAAAVRAKAGSQSEGAESYTSLTVSAPRNSPAVTPPQPAATKAPAARPKTAAPSGAMPTAAPAPVDDGATPVRFETAKPAKTGLLGKRRARKEAAATTVAAPSTQSAAQAADERARAQERERMTVFGAREAAPRAAPKYLWLILTVLLVLVMFAVAAFAAPRVIAALFGPSDTVENTQLAAAPEDAAPGDLDGAIAATSSMISSAAGELETTLDETELAALEDQVPGFDESNLLPPEATANVAEPRGVVPSPAEAERFYAATGVWLRAPRLPLQPRTTSLDELTVGLAETAPETAEAPSLARSSPDPRLPTQMNPPPPGATFPRDARGFFLATDEGTLTPQGLLIYAGRPDIMPPTRPGTVAPDEPVFPVTYAPLSPPETRLRARPESVEAAAVALREEEAAEDAPAEPEAAEPEATDAAVAGADVPDDPANLPVTAMASDGATPGAVGLDALESGQTGDAALPAATADGWTGATPELRPDDAAGSEARALLEPGTQLGAADDANSETLGEAIAEAAEGAASDIELASNEAPPEILTALPGPAPRNRPEGLAPEEEEAAALPADEPPAEILSAWNGPTPAQRPEGLAPDDLPQVLTAWDGPVPGVRPEDLAPATSEELAEGTEGEDAPAQSPSLASALLDITANSTNPLAGATQQAVAVARRPDSRPANFSRVVAQQQARQPAAPAASAPTQVASAAVRPTGPVPGSVASAATIEDAINLRDINLIGIYGRPGDRRALIRMPNGRYLRVGVGDSLDGGQVTVIGDSALNYVKRGRTLSLQVAEG
ncbi:hypothetical protein ACXN5S_13770 [Pseudoroseicyclus sp. H15]